MTDINWSECLKKLGACRSYADDADEYVSSREAWDRCVDPHRLVWFVARLGYARTAERIAQPAIAWLSPRSVEDCQSPAEAAEVLAVAVSNSYGRVGYWEIADQIKSAISYDMILEAMRRECGN